MPASPDGPPPPPAEFAVYAGDQLVLSASPGAGLLFSVATPPPEGAPRHPFLSARAYDPFREGVLRELLDASSNFEDFLKRLVAAGYDVGMFEGSPPLEAPNGQRVYQGDELVGVAWREPGLVGSISPADTARWSSIARVTSYTSSDSADALREAGLAGAWDTFELRLASAGLRLEPCGAP